MPKMRDLIIVAALMSQTGVVRAQTIDVFGVGSTASCGLWLDRRQHENWFDIGNWALGYVSGAATFGEIGNPLGKTDPDGVFYWLDNYCRSNPSVYFRAAVKAFINEHQR